MKTISFLGLCFLTTSIAVSQNKLSLQDAVTNALASRSEYKRAQLEKAIAQQRIGDSHLKYAPDLRGEFNLQFNSIIPTSIIPIGQLNPQTPTNEVRAVQFGRCGEANNLRSICDKRT